MTDYDRMDDLIRRAAADYNVPNEVPRDAMWAQIQAARAAQSTRGRIGDSPLRWLGGWSTGRLAWPSMGIAAALLVAAGISIGRRLELRDHARSLGLPAPSVATARDTGADLALRLTVAQHLAGTEALLTSFRSESRPGTRNAPVDEHITTWSRDLLATTRMLESSTASDDPAMRRLLENLDLVLTQIAQYAGAAAHRPDDLELIQRSIDNRGVITELRTIPARGFRAGT